jgi:hypothetical protein
VLFTTISKIYGIKVDSFHILEKGWGDLQHYLNDRWYRREFIVDFGEGLERYSPLYR